LKRPDLVLSVVVLCLCSASALAAETTLPAGAEPALSLFAGAWDWFVKGGPVMYPIALTSVIGLAFVIERTLAFRRESAIPGGLKVELQDRLDARDLDAAMRLCEERPCSLSRVVRSALQRAAGDLHEMEKAAEDAGVRELWLLRRNVRPIGVVASVSPLLGLLGTVLGLIGAFVTMSQSATVDAKAFAGDIYEAVLTTFFGLTVAIPMLVCYHWLHGKAEALIVEIEETVTDLLLRLRKHRENDRAEPARAQTERDA
jgi:biopolymer transport protein ExbB